MSSRASNLIHWLQQLEKLIKGISPGLKILKRQVRPLHQIFQAYVYALVAQVAMNYGYSIYPRQLDMQGHFVFKWSPRAYYSGPQTFSYFEITDNRRKFFLVFNIDVLVGSNRILHAFQPVLNLDIAFITGQMPINAVHRSQVAFFLECKSLNHASPETVATVLGQSFLVKRGQNHPYTDIEDLLAVRGRATSSSKALSKLISSWRRRIKIVDFVSPRLPGESILMRATRHLMAKI